MSPWPAPGRGRAKVGPSAARANAWCRIQGDGSAWLHSPQVAIAASLSLNESFSWSPQLGGRDVIVRSCPFQEETDWTENFPRPGSAHQVGAPTGMCSGASCCCHWGVGGSPQPEAVLWVTGDVSRPCSSHSQACPWSRPFAACRAIATGGALFCFGFLFLAEFPSTCLCPEVNFFLKRQFLNQINKEMGGILGPALCPRRCLQD